MRFWEPPLLKELLEQFLYRPSSAPRDVGILAEINKGTKRKNMEDGGEFSCGKETVRENQEDEMIKLMKLDSGSL